MTGFEGHGDFYSDNPYERYVAHQAAKGNWPPPFETVTDDGTVRDDLGNFVGIDQPAVVRIMKDDA